MSKPISELLSYKYSKDPVKLDKIQDLTDSKSEKVDEVNYRTVKRLPMDTNENKDKVILNYMNSIGRELKMWKGEGATSITKLVGDYACRILTGTDVESWKKSLESPLEFMNTLNKSLTRLNSHGTLGLPIENRKIASNIYSSLTGMSNYMTFHNIKLDTTSSKRFSIPYFEGLKTPTPYVEVLDESGEIKDLVFTSRVIKMDDGVKIDKSGKMKSVPSGEALLGLEQLDPIPYYSNSETYSELRDPYHIQEVIDLSDGEGFNIASLKKKLNQAGYTVGYKTFAGFEMGTNNNWSIKLRPYESFEHGQLTCTPPLPTYVLPNFWLEDDNLSNIYLGTSYSGLYPSMSSKYDSLNSISQSKVESKDIGVRWFSYAEHTPVLNYAINFGTFKNESVRLFGGMSMEMFTGMNYAMTMTISILDDSYNSMYKYMATYINSIYDPVTNSVAPYYNMSFEIELTIFRTAGQINQKHKFIAVPIDYSPTLDGSQDANECRVDITFGIIGYINPINMDKSTVKPSTIGRDGSLDNTTLNFKRYNSKAKTYLQNTLDSMPMSDIKWGDIILNAGRDNKVGRSAVIGSNANTDQLGINKGVSNENYFGLT